VNEFLAIFAAGCVFTVVLVIGVVLLHGYLRPDVQRPAIRPALPPVRVIAVKAEEVRP
jgi:hypothetical protein